MSPAAGSIHDLIRASCKTDFFVKKVRHFVSLKPALSVMTLHGAACERFAAVACGCCALGALISCVLNPCTGFCCHNAVKGMSGSHYQPVSLGGTGGDTCSDATDSGLP